MAVRLELAGVTVDHGARSLSLDFLVEGDRIAIVGPSGSGKTTILEAVAGIQKVTAGRVSFNGEVWHGEDAPLAVADRAIGLVPQDEVLFPHMNVRQNISFGARNGSDDFLLKAIDRFDLSRFLERRPDRLSGGEKRRVAILRALATRPRLLLLDEPFAGLDDAMRERVIEVLREYQLSSGCGLVLVTHDKQEAIALCEWELVVSEGRVIASRPIAAAPRRFDAAPA